MSQWKSIFEVVPTDEQLCWVRTAANYRQPFQAVWDQSEKKFISVTTSIPIEAYIIERWKSA